MSNLEKVMDMALKDIEMPYLNQAKLSKVALNIKQNYSELEKITKATINHKYRSYDTMTILLTFSTVFLRNYNSINKLNAINKEDLTKIVEDLSLFINRQIPEELLGLIGIGLSKLNITQRKTENFKELLLGPTKGLAATEKILSYKNIDGIMVLDSIISKEDPNILRKLKSAKEIKKEEPSIFNFPLFSYNSGDVHPDIFIKWVDPSRVKVVDHEIALAKFLRSQELNVPEFYGFICGENNYLIAQKIKGISFAPIAFRTDLRAFIDHNRTTDMSIYIKYLRNNFDGPITMEILRKRVQQAYRSLGEEVQKLSSVFNHADLSLRNVMLEYVKGRPKIYFVDFEKSCSGKCETDNPINEIATEIKSIGELEYNSFISGVGDLAKKIKVK